MGLSDNALIIVHPNSSSILPTFPNTHSFFFLIRIQADAKNKKLKEDNKNKQIKLYKTNKKIK